MHTELMIERAEYAGVFDRKKKIKFVSQLPSKKLYTNQRINVVDHLNNIVLKLKSTLN